MPLRKRPSPLEVKETRAKPREEWRTSEDLPGETRLARADAFFGRLEHYVRATRVITHGLTEIPLEIVPTVLYAASYLPAYVRQSRVIAAAKILVEKGPEAPILRLYWAIDALEAAGVLDERQLYNLFSGARVQADPTKLAALEPFSRAWFAARWMQADAEAKESSDASQRHEATVLSEAIFQRYCTKVMHETSALRGEAVLSGAQTGGRPRGQVTPEELVRAVKARLDDGLNLTDAQTAAAAEHGVSVRTIQRARAQLDHIDSRRRRLRQTGLRSPIPSKK